jgi:hypothetical protein
MPIVTSEVTDDSPQIDGRRWITERHLDQVGAAHFRTYMALSDQVIDPSDTVSILDQELIDTEIQRNLAVIYTNGPAASVVVVYASLSDIRQALREAYRTVTREQAFALGAFLNTLTNPQLGTLFGVSGAALTALRNRLQAKAAQWADYIAAVGE